jgi:AcrR family transcriptional regulator
MDLILEVGYDSISIQDITDKANLGRATFYLHFKDKDELIAALDESLADGDVVLVKGSRSAAMEKVVERILTHENNNKRVN